MKFNLTKEEARLVRSGLRIVKDSCEVGPDLSQYFTGLPEAREKKRPKICVVLVDSEAREKKRLARDTMKCNHDLKIVKALLDNLKGSKS